jgi:hypothetical protein
VRQLFAVAVAVFPLSKEVFIFVVERRTQFYFSRYDVPTVFSSEYTFVVFRNYEEIDQEMKDRDDDFVDDLVPPLLYEDEPDSDYEEGDEPSKGNKDNNDILSQRQEEMQQNFHAIVEEIIQKADEYARQKNAARSNTTGSRTTYGEYSDALRPIFNAVGKNKAKLLLEEMREGWFSDPPCVSFYARKINKYGTEASDKDGL